MGQELIEVCVQWTAEPPRRGGLPDLPLWGLTTRSWATNSTRLCNPSSMDLTKRIGQRLRAARQAQGLSLSDLSGRTGSLSKSRISNYEQGIRRMGLEEAQELAVALGTVTATYLLCLDDKDPLSQDERHLVDRYRDTDSRGRETILKVAETQAIYRVENTPKAPDGEGGDGTPAGS